MSVISGFKTSMVVHSELLLSKCAQFREKDEFIDVWLKGGEDVFSSHRLMFLQAAIIFTPCLHMTSVKESLEDVIELKDESISTAALKTVLGSIYVRGLDVNDKNVLKFSLQPITFKLLVLFHTVFRYPQTEFAKCQIDVQTYRQILTIANRRRLTQTCKKPYDVRYRQCSRKSVKVKISCPIWMLINILTFSAEITRCSPSATFVFTSMMQWVKHKKEERMTVAAKVIGAFRLGLVRDIREIIKSSTQTK